MFNNANPKGILLKNIIGKKAFNTGLYGAGAYAYIKFDVYAEDILESNIIRANVLYNTEDNTGEKLYFERSVILPIELNNELQI